MSQNDQVDVSVIIPTYNRAGLVAEAIESVLRQARPPREIIVVDDGSTDNTLERLEPYRSKIVIVTTSHRGVAHARNAGMKAANGTYLSFLDSDDRYLPHKLALQVQVLERFPDVGMVSSEFSGFGDGVEEEFHLKTYHSPAFRNGETYDDYFEQSVSLRDAGLDCPPWSDRKIYLGHIFDQYLRVLFISTNTLMIRRSVLNQVREQDESFPLFHDYEFALRITKQHRVAFVDLPTYQLRYHAGQVSTTKRSDGSAVLVQKQRDLLRVMERHGLLDDVYYQANKTMVDGVMVRLHRALGIALMCHPGHEAEARSVLSSGKRYGLSAPGLRLLTYMPSVARRIAMKVYRVISKIRKKA